MRKTLSTFVFVFSALLSLAFSAGMAHANEKASASAGSGTPTARLEPFVVNLASFDRYLQTAVTLQLAAGEVADKIKVYMPMVRHVVIMTLSSKDSAELQSTEGKKVLIDELKTKINQVLEAKSDHGVNDVFFETFVIQ
ncbi:flagellar basal body-associated FliL family protein [Undibacterium sp. Di24W]|uniref:flagellar basal body-associated FliL family protein n=1 Tax=Undibacterium sp. Di24W TaxID=3413033 RepID=UPI003BEF4F1D